MSAFSFHTSLTERVTDLAAPHLWVCDVDALPVEIARDESLLSSYELAHIARLRDAAEQQRARRGRLVIRHLFAPILNVQPRDIAFARNEHGKPLLISAAGKPCPNFQFSWSHSENLLLVGIALGKIIGVDIEVIKPDIDVKALAHDHFLPSETVWLSALPFNNQLQGFYRCWTLKEAYVKACGTSIATDLNCLAVTRHNDGSLSVRDNQDLAEHGSLSWLQKEIHLGGHHASLAAMAWPAPQT